MTPREVYAPVSRGNISSSERPSSTGPSAAQTKALFVVRKTLINAFLQGYAQPCCRLELGGQERERRRKTNSDTIERDDRRQTTHQNETSAKSTTKKHKEPALTAGHLLPTKHPPPLHCADVHPLPSCTIAPQHPPQRLSMLASPCVETSSPLNTLHKSRLLWLSTICPLEALSRQA